MLKHLLFYCNLTNLTRDGKLFICGYFLGQMILDHHLYKGHFQEKITCLPLHLVGHQRVHKHLRLQIGPMIILVPCLIPIEFVPSRDPHVICLGPVKYATKRLLPNASIIMSFGVHQSHVLHIYNKHHAFVQPPYILHTFLRSICTFKTCKPKNSWPLLINKPNKNGSIVGE